MSERVSLVVAEVVVVGQGVLVEEGRGVGGQKGVEEEGKGDPEMVELVRRSLEVFSAMRRERPASRADTSPRQVSRLNCTFPMIHSTSIL